MYSGWHEASPVFLAIIVCSPGYGTDCARHIVIRAFLSPWVIFEISSHPTVQRDVWGKERNASSSTLERSECGIYRDISGLGNSGMARVHSCCLPVRGSGAFLGRDPPAPGVYVVVLYKAEQHTRETRTASQRISHVPLFRSPNPKQQCRVSLSPSQSAECSSSFTTYPNIWNVGASF